MPSEPSKETQQSEQAQRRQAESPSKLATETQNLLDALEKEKIILIQNEQKYSAEIVSLNERVVAAEKVANEEKTRTIALELQIKSLQDADVLKSQNHQLIQSELERKLQETQLKLEESISEANKLKLDLGSATGDVDQLRAKVVEFQETIQACNHDNETLSMRILKDRETSKLKISECVREIEVYRIAVKKLQKTRAELEESLATAKSQYEMQIQELKTLSFHSQEISDMIIKTTADLTNKHSEEVEKLGRMLQASKTRNEELDEEYRQAVKAEHHKYSELFKAFQELAEESNGISKSLKEAKKSGADLKSITRELTNVIKDQKFKIVELSNKNEASFTLFEEKCMMMESQVKSLSETKSDLEGIKKELEKNKSAMAKNQELIEALESEKTVISRTLSDQMASFQKERDTLLSKIRELEQDLTGKAAASSDFDQALRIKNKMLDDQNDTIKTLKQNLENKIRDHAALLQEVSTAESKIEESLAKEKKRVRDLTHELATQEEAFEQLQNAFQECKEERDALHSELMDVSKKLQERNVSIARIEEEVSRVKNIFSAKEQKLRMENDDLIKSREIAVDEVKRFYESQSSRLKILERERESLFENVKRLKTQVMELETEKETREEEMKRILLDVERQKSRFAKLKEAMDL
ncbi:leucine rich repeat [Rhizoclosmatium hyalinum]|nr:leucine rich repeat [Rhizoclosmatium hyalinum]